MVTMVTKHYTNEIITPSHLVQFSRAPVKLDYLTDAKVTEKRKPNNSFEMSSTDFMASLRYVPDRSIQSLSVKSGKESSRNQLNVDLSKVKGAGREGRLVSGNSIRYTRSTVSSGREKILPELKKKKNKRYSHIKSKTDTNLEDSRKKEDNKSKGAPKYNPRRIHSAIVWRSNPSAKGNKFQGRAISASTNHTNDARFQNNTTVTPSNANSVTQDRFRSSFTNSYPSGTDVLSSVAGGSKTLETVQKYSYWASYINGRRGMNMYEPQPNAKKKPSKISSDSVIVSEDKDERIQENRDRFSTIEALKEYNKEDLVNSEDSDNDLQAQRSEGLPTRVTSVSVPKLTKEINYKPSLTDSIDLYKNFSKFKLYNRAENSKSYLHNNNDVEDDVKKRLLGRSLPKTSKELDKYKSLTKRIIQSAYSTSSKDYQDKGASMNENTTHLSCTRSQEVTGNGAPITTNPTSVLENIASYSYGKKSYFSEAEIGNNLDYDTWRNNYNYIYGYEAPESVTSSVSKIRNFPVRSIDNVASGVSNRKTDEQSDIISRFLKERTTANDIIDQCLDDRGKSNYVSLKYVQEKTQNSNYMQPMEKTQISNYLQPMEKTQNSNYLQPMEKTQNSNYMQPMEKTQISNYLQPAEKTQNYNYVQPIEKTQSSVYLQRDNQSNEHSNSLFSLNEDFQSIREDYLKGSRDETSYLTNKTAEKISPYNDFPSASYSANYIRSWMDGFETVGGKNSYSDSKKYSLTDSVVLAKSIQNPIRKIRKFSLDDSSADNYQPLKSKTLMSPENSVGDLVAQDTLPPLMKNYFSSKSVPANLNTLGRSFSAKKVRIALENNRYHFYTPEPQ